MKSTVEGGIVNVDNTTFRKRKREISKQDNTKATRGELKKVKREILKRNEKMYLQTTLASPNFIDNAGTVFNITNIPQGTTGVTDSQRVGDRIYLKSIELNLVVAVADAFNYLRVILFSYTPAATPSPSNVLNAVHYLSPYQHDNRKNFRILHDELLCVTTYEPTKAIMSKIIGGFSDRSVQFQGGSVLGTNGVWLLMISDSSAVAHPAVSTQIKVNYSDA